MLIGNRLKELRESIQTQIHYRALSIGFRFQVNQFDGGHKRITASTWAFSSNFDRILDFASHHVHSPQ